MPASEARSGCAIWLGSGLVFLLILLPAGIIYRPSYGEQIAQDAPVIPRGVVGAASSSSAPRLRKLSQSEGWRHTGSRQQRRQRKRQQKWDQQHSEDELTRHDRKSGSLLHTHVIPQGGALSIECAAGTYIRSVRFASFGTPVTNVSSANGERLLAVDPKCHSRRSERVVADACVGQSHCCLPVGTDNFRDDPCRGVIKTLAVTLEGCEEVKQYTRFKRHCSLMGQPLLCDEDIEFLTTLDLPPAPEPVLPHVAIMVDTSYRPHLQVSCTRLRRPRWLAPPRVLSCLAPHCCIRNFCGSPVLITPPTQHFVVHNVRNHTGWHVQLFHGPSNGAQLKALFADLVSLKAITFTDLGSDYMEDWQRLSSMMLLDTFWQSGTPDTRSLPLDCPNMHVTG